MTHHIPTEIILAFGEHLDGPSLFASLQVNRHWYVSLHSIVWLAITKRQWYNPSFPINRSTRLFAPFRSKTEEINATSLLSCLRGTQTLEWSDMRLTRRTRLRDPYNVVAPPSPPLSPILFSDLRVLFQLMPHLKRVVLAIAFNGPMSATIMSVINLQNLQNLRVLHVSLPTIFPNVLVEKLYPLFAKLEELVLGGCWYREAYIGEIACQSHEPWAIKRLSVDRVFISFLKYCQALISLSFKHPMSQYNTRVIWRDEMLRHLNQLPKLKKITVGRRSDLKEDVYKLQASEGPIALWVKKTHEGRVEIDQTLESVMKCL